MTEPDCLSTRCGCHGNRMFSLERRDKMEIKVNAAHYSSDVRGGRLLIAVGEGSHPFVKEGISYVKVF